MVMNVIFFCAEEFNDTLLFSCQTLFCQTAVQLQNELWFVSGNVQLLLPTANIYLSRNGIKE